MRFAERLRELRDAKDLSEAKLADLSGLPFGTIHGYGLGARRVTEVLVNAGCRDFFVAYSSEAAAISGIAPPKTISVLHGPLSDSDAVYIKAAGFRPSL